MARETPEQGEGGRFQARVTLDAVLGVFERVEGPPVITASDVASVLDCSGDTARTKLGTLHDQGRVAKRTAGRPTLWWRTDREDGAATKRPASGQGKGVPSQTLLNALNGRTPIVLDPDGVDPDELLASFPQEKVDDIIIIEERDEEETSDE